MSTETITNEADDAVRDVKAQAYEALVSKLESLGFSTTDLTCASVVDLLGAILDNGVQASIVAMSRDMQEKVLEFNSFVESSVKEMQHMVAETRSRTGSDFAAVLQDVAMLKVSVININMDVARLGSDTIKLTNELTYNRSSNSNMGSVSDGLCQFGTMSYMLLGAINFLQVSAYTPSLNDTFMPNDTARRVSNVNNAYLSVDQKAAIVALNMLLIRSVNERW